MKERDTSNNTGQVEPTQKITHTIPDQHTESTKLRNSTNSHTVRCTLTAGCADVEVQNLFDGGNNITGSGNCKYRTAATLCTVETWVG